MEFLLARLKYVTVFSLIAEFYYSERIFIVAASFYGNFYRFFFYIEVWKSDVSAFDDKCSTEK